MNPKFRHDLPVEPCAVATLATQIKMMYAEEVWVAATFQ
jgi:hypothetical protein